MVPFLPIVPGQDVSVGDRLYRITQLLGLEAVLARDLITGTVHQLAVRDLSPVRVNPQPQAAADSNGRPDLAQIPDEHWTKARSRFEILQPLLDFPVPPKQMVLEQAARAGVHRTTIYRWLRSYRAEGELSSLLDSKSGPPGGHKNLVPEVEAIVEAAIQNKYLTRDRLSAQQICREVLRKCHEAGVQPPHPNTVRNRIARIPDPIKIEARFGGRAAREQFAPVWGSFPGADAPLAVVQIDHTLLDIVLVDDVYRQPVGRPWLTLAIDVFSRMVAGFYVSFDPPGAAATGLCLAHAILPKELWLAKIGVNGSWPLWGKMRSVHCDNAKEFHGEMLRRACEQYGIEPQFRPVRQPNYGGHIERLLGTFSRDIHSLPGTTFSRPEKRKGYDSERKAAFTLSEFEKWFATMIVEVYHERVHSAIGMPPRKKYEQGIFGTEQKPGVGVPPRCSDERRLRLDFMPFEKRTVRPVGIVLDGIQYYKDVLRPWINAIDPDDASRKRLFTIRRDPRDISAIYFFDPELEQYFDIPYRDTSHPPISIWELREVRRRLKESGKEHVDEAAIFDAYARMRQMEEEAAAKSKAARRNEQRRRTHAGGAPKRSASATAMDAGGLNGVDVEPFDEIEVVS